MNKEELEAFAREAAKGLKTEKDLNEFSQMLTKVTVGNCQGNCRLDGLTQAAFSIVFPVCILLDLSGFKYTTFTGSQFRVSRLQRSGCCALAAS